MSVNPEDWDVQFAFPKTLTEEENSSQCLKILPQFTIEDENELAEIRGVFSQKNYEKILGQ